MLRMPPEPRSFWSDIVSRKPYPRIDGSYPDVHAIDTKQTNAEHVFFKMRFSEIGYLPRKNTVPGFLLILAKTIIVQRHLFGQTSTVCPQVGGFLSNFQKPPKPPNKTSNITMI